MTLVLACGNRNGSISLAGKLVTSSHLPLSIDGINPQIIKTEYAVRGAILERACQIEANIKKGQKYPFESLISCNIGNPFSVGKRPISFIRQVISCVENRELIDSLSVPLEARERAKEMLDGMTGGPGAYTHSQGILFVREHIAEFIQKRDGYPSNPDNIFLTAGASAAATSVLNMLIANPNVGILTPFPTYPLYTAEITLKNGKCIPYFLKESEGWDIDFSELEQALNKSRKDGVDVKALIIINPGNPTGSILSGATIKKIVKFCSDNNLLIVADEVYQDNVYNTDKPFISFKKVVSEMKSDVQLVSFHSISKGFAGECGHRGGYMEIVNIPDDVKAQFYKMASICLCPSSVGQLMMDIIVRPPECEISSKIYNEEKNRELHNLKKKAIKLAKTINGLKGLNTQQAEGSMYLFPSIHLPKKAYEAAKNVKIGGKLVHPDMFWCMKLLENTGIVVVPGSGFGQEPGTNHFRVTFLPEAEKMDIVIDRLSQFQRQFMDNYS